MDAFRTFIPNQFSLPRRISRLGELAYNLWWSWNPDAQRLYSMIDRELWDRLNRNPVLFLRQIERSRLNAVTNNRFFLDYYDRILRTFDQYMEAEDTWFTRNHSELRGSPIAYFSMEFGIHEIFPIYAGGLGVLSGDHVKEASDLGLPFIAVGLYYSEGYFAQRITEDGWQEAGYSQHSLDDLPVLAVLDPEDKPITVSVTLPGRVVSARVWEIRVGRVPLYLMDTNIPENQPNDRALSARLYSSDPEVRISQEILLGMGGLRALRMLGYNPSVWHMNEGHSAFLILERASELVAGGRSTEEALKVVRATNIFTTHTPVAAGNDEFPLWLTDKYFSHIWPELKLTRDQFIDLARHKVQWGDTFSMPMLALRYSAASNAVSELHGKVARRMWHEMWPDLREDQVPIGHITNGIHTNTWLARRMGILYDRYLGPDWRDHIQEGEVWDQINSIPDEQLWSVRRHLKRKLVAYLHDLARYRWMKGGVHPVQTLAAGVLLDPNALTIGFARRFAPYKRANLILRDMDRLLGLLNRPGMPVQIIFAGKSHPDHESGKLLIQEVYRAVKNSRGGGRLVFVEEYDMNLARYLVQGVDIWLNTPRRPNEASGTSGQKAALNGALNFSVLDGWWREGYNGKNGWAIGEDREYDNPDQQDQADSDSLIEILENEIIPLYYTERTADGMPVEWISRIKESIRTLAPQFSMRRMVIEYLETMYLTPMRKPVSVEAED